jgi:hypothetical protein
LSGRDGGLFDLLLDLAYERAIGGRETAAGGDLGGEGGVEFGEEG